MSRKQRFADKIQETVAENEGVSLDMVEVVVGEDANGTLEPTITVEIEGTRYQAIWSDGESYSDLQRKWKEVD